MPTVTLAPLGLGELLDQTFSTFRKHFWLFAGIIVVPQGVMVALNIIVQVTMHPVMFAQPQKDPQAAAQAAAAGMRAAMASFAILIPYLLVYTLALGATTYALSEIYLGRSTTIRDSYRAVRRKLGRLLKVILLIGLRFVGIFMLVGIGFGLVVAATVPIAKSFPWVVLAVGLMALVGMIGGGILAVVYMVRYTVAVPAAVLEKLSARQALKRSVVLTKGYLWRLLLVGFLMWLISITIVSLCQAPFTVAALLVTVKGGRPSLWLTIPNLLLGGAASVVTAPLFMISFAIAYYDLRVRKEAFDLQLMMSNLDLHVPGSTGVVGAGSSDEATLEESSVLGVFLVTILTGGIYLPIWFLMRRKALNRLNSPEKVGLAGLLIALLVFVANFSIPVVGSFVWGSLVQAENTLGPLHPAVLLAGAILIGVYCFRVRRILLDHLAPQQDGMFSASIRFQYDDLLSRMGTFFLSIYYLQYKINGLLDRLTPSVNEPAAVIPLTPAETLPPSLAS